MRKFKVSMEDTAVDEVYNKELEEKRLGESGNLDDDINSNIDSTSKPENNTDSETKADEDTDENKIDTDEPEDTDENSSNMINAEGGEDDLNNALEAISMSIEYSIALEAEVDRYYNKNFSQEDIAEISKTIASKAGSGILSSLGYLKDLGITYGPILLQKLGQGLIRILTMTAKSLYYSSKFITKQIKLSLSGMIKAAERISSLEESLKLLKNQNFKETKETFYSNKAVIRTLALDGKFLPLESMETYSIFYRDYITRNSVSYDNEVHALIALITQFMSNKIYKPEELLYGNNIYQYLKQATIKGYNSSLNNTELYAYPTILPGNIRLMAYLPERGLESFSELDIAFKNSSIFLGIDLEKNTNDNIKKVDYLTIVEIEKYLSILKVIVAHSDAANKLMNGFSRFKASIGYKLSMAVKSATSKVINDKESLQLLKFINIKIQYIETVFFKSISNIETMNRKVIFKSLDYIEKSIKEISKSHN